MSNPWLSMWLKPKETIQAQLEKPSSYSFWGLISIYGFLSLLNLFQSMVLGEILSVGWVILLSVLLSPVWGYILISIWSWIMSVTGRWLKGEGSFSQLRVTFAYSCVPFTVSAFIWILMILGFSPILFSDVPNHLLSYPQTLIFLGLLTVKMIMAIWAFILYVQSLCVVQKFSVLKSILNVVIAWIVGMAFLTILRFCLLFFIQG